MKYRKLLREELDGVRDEFVQFLAANSITADEWDSLKTTDNEKAEKLIEMFSDIFWEKSLSNIRCVEMREPCCLRVVKFEDSQALLIELRIQEDAGIDLTRPEDLSRLASGQADIAQAEPQMYRGMRTYEHERNAELFNFIEQGAAPCKTVVWEGLNRMIKD